jgi:ligand-binding sensor domain-containing protein
MILLLHLSLCMLACRDTSNENHKQQSKVTPHTFNKNNTNMAFDHFTVEDGLSDNDVIDMAEDSDGILWFGTAKGLTRFDGIEFKSYFKIENVDSSHQKVTRDLAGIDAMAVDRDGTLWMIENNRGVISVSPHDEKMISYENQKVNHWISDFHRRIFIVDEKIYFSQPFGYIDKKTKTYNIIDSQATQTTLIKDKFYVFTYNEHSTNNDVLHVYDAKTSHVLSKDSIDKVIMASLNSITSDNREIIYLGYQNGGFNEYNVRTKEFKVHTVNRSLPPNFRNGCTIRRLDYDSISNAVFLSGFCKFMRFDCDTFARFPFLKNLPSPYDANSLSDSQIRFTKRDRFGNIWIGCHETGLNLYNVNNDRFKVYRAKPGDSISLIQNQVNALCFDQENKLYIGTQSHGLYIENDTLMMGLKHFNQIRYPSVTGGNIDRISTLTHCSSNNKVYSANWGYILYEYNHSKFDMCRPKNLNIEAKGPFQFILQSFFLNNEYLMHAHWGGILSIYNIKTDKWYPSATEWQSNKSIVAQKINALTKSIDYFDETFYFAFDRTERSLYKVKSSLDDFLSAIKGDTCIGIDNFIFEPIELLDSMGNEYRYSDVTKIKTYDGQFLYVGTNNGLYVHNIKLNSTMKIGLPDGLLSENIISFEKYKSSLWIGTDKGLFELNTKSHKIVRKYTTIDGLPSNSFRPYASALSSNGKLAFGTAEGVIVFYPDKISNPMAVDVKCVGVEINGKPSILLPSYELDHDENNLRISFGFENLSITKNGLYKYRLVGFSDQWKTSRLSPVAQYTNLQPGKYVFEATSLANSSQLNILNLPIVINNIWYNLWWVQLLTLLVSLLIGKLWWTHRQDKIKKYDEEKNKLIKYLQIQTLQSQINPHFIFNVLGSMQNKILTDSPETANKHLVNLSKLIRRFLDSTVSSSAKDNKISTSEISLAEEMELLEMYIQFEQMQRPDKFDYIFKISPNIEPTNTYLPPMLIQPYVENAIKHGLFYKNTKGLLTLQFDIEDEMLLIEIIDNGVGRSKAGEIQQESRKIYVSRGKSLVEERVNLLNEVGYKIDINTSDNVNGGTKVSIQIN